MTQRRLHRILGTIFAPFFVFAGITAIPLFWRKDGVYPESVKEFLVSLHTWEFAAKYIGVILAFALVIMSASGLILSFGANDAEGNADDPSGGAGE